VPSHEPERIQTTWSTYMSGRMTPLGYILLFSPATAGLLILSMAAVFVRSRTAVICCGIVAALLFIAECGFFFILPGAGGHGSRDVGWEYYRIPFFMLLGSTAVTWLFFVYGFRRARRSDNAALNRDGPQR
jgi:hypothetical protein